MKSRICFKEPYSGAIIPYSKIHKVNEHWFKDKNFNLILWYEGERDNFSTEENEEIYEQYVDMLDLYIFYQALIKESNESKE